MKSSSSLNLVSRAYLEKVQNSMDWQASQSGKGTNPILKRRHLACSVATVNGSKYRQQNAVPEKATRNERKVCIHLVMGTLLGFFISIIPYNLTNFSSHFFASFNDVDDAFPGCS